MDILLNKEKFILIYIDYNEHNLEIINRFVSILNIKFILILSNNDKFNFNNDMIIEIIPENKLEYELLNNCEFIIYLSNFKKSDILEEYLTNNYKLVFFNIISLEEELIYIKNDYNIIKFIDNDKSILERFLNLYKTLDKINNNELYNRNITININKVLNHNNKINIVTVFKNIDNNILKIIQLKCIIENLNNTNIEKILIIGYNLDEILKEIMNQFPNKIIIYNKDGNISYKDILEIIHLKFKNNSIIFLLMSDIIIPNQESLKNLNLELGILDKKEVYSISRLDKIYNGNIIKSNKLSKSFFSTEQDAWIFETPLILNDNSLNKLSNVYFYNYLSNLSFNNVINDNNYILINNTKKYKIIRFMLDNNLNNRTLIDKDLNEVIDYDNIYILPSNENIDNISIEQLIKLINLNENDIYSIKCYLFNKFLKNKIMDNI